MVSTIQKLQEDGTSTCVLHYTRADNHRVSQAKDIHLYSSTAQQYGSDVYHMSMSLGADMKKWRAGSTANLPAASSLPRQSSAEPATAEYPTAENGAGPSGAQHDEAGLSAEHRLRGLRLHGIHSTQAAADTLEARWRAMRLFTATTTQLRDFLGDHGLSTLGNKELLLKKAAAKLQALRGVGELQLCHQF